mmetsp:Transcript_22235/g.29761  ORF Transcript_22235/g.29761 Transcript_22235/m.29761 type:complete len:130 (-) Transcript_22235:117-506(-)|eukprot:CAMPEP_0185586146 /NCGR_PEP_ID=MMETSP0434-20130131/42778_1 /TAXON_ID=626734 ORGANISM="Favella taraikaensis, Strain Fe Narragansett Bay" /NCGR_SAMPLE_ID=MMETSP0434 /ASSEMBLY_ACC=CAM_ASM_000379 /LENGTH=129 /DNA_ID=CAMNT_0028207047 /DNA_START=73 /DNA_END=462 /DNA_ORIENTATION=-
MDSEQIERLENSLADLRELAASIEAGSVCREDVLWRLRSYFHVVSFLSREFEEQVADDEQTLAAANVLGDIQGLVSELILELADQELSGSDEEEFRSSVSPLPKVATLAANPSIIPFPDRKVTTSEDRW